MAYRWMDLASTGGLLVDRRVHLFESDSLVVIWEGLGGEPISTGLSRSLLLLTFLLSVIVFSIAPNLYQYENQPRKHLCSLPVACLTFADKIMGLEKKKKKKKKSLRVPCCTLR
jgi:hypothetical protein